MYVCIIVYSGTSNSGLSEKRSTLYSGQNTIPRMNLPYNTRTSNLRKAATSEFSRTDNRGIPYSHVQHKITSMNGQTTTPPN